MPRFSYRAYDDTGARATGVIDSETREAAIESLFRQGRYPLELVEGGRLPARAGGSARYSGPGLLTQ
jgi:type II secretory pathway component PulF